MSCKTLIWRPSVPIDGADIDPATVQALVKHYPNLADDMTQRLRSEDIPFLEGLALGISFSQQRGTAIGKMIQAIEDHGGIEIWRQEP